MLAPKLILFALLALWLFGETAVSSAVAQSGQWPEGRRSGGPQTSGWSENRSSWNLRQATPDHRHLRGLSGFTRLRRYHERRPYRLRPQIVASYDLPYWRAGYRDTALSNDCKRGTFVEKLQGKWQILFTAKQGPAVFGVARRGNNLLDRFSVGEFGKIYLFLNSGASNCEVWVWVDDWPPQLEEDFNQAQREQARRGQRNPPARQGRSWPEPVRKVSVE